MKPQVRNRSGAFGSQYRRRGCWVLSLRGHYKLGLLLECRGTGQGDDALGATVRLGGVVQPETLK